MRLCHFTTLAQTSITANICNSNNLSGSLCAGSSCTLVQSRSKQCVKNLDATLSTWTILLCTTDPTTSQHAVVVQTYSDSACSDLLATSIAAPSECNGGKSYVCGDFPDAFPSLPTNSSYRLCSGTTCNSNCQTVYIQANRCISPKASTSVLLQCSSVDSTSTLKGFSGSSCMSGSEVQSLGPYKSGDCVATGQTSVRLICPPTNGGGATPPSSSSPSSTSPASTQTPSSIDTSSSPSSDPTRAQIISLVCACVIGFASLVLLTTIHCWASPCCSIDAPATRSGYMPVACEYPDLVHAFRLAVVGLIIAAFIVNSWSSFQLNSSTVIQATIMEFRLKGAVSSLPNQPYSSCSHVSWGCILLQVGSWFTIAAASLAGLYALCALVTIMYSESKPSRKPSHQVYQFHLLAAVALSASVCAWALIMHEYWMASLSDEGSQLSLQFDVSWYLLLGAACMQLILCYVTRSQWKYWAYQHRRALQERVSVQFESRLSSENDFRRRTQYSAHSVPSSFRKPVECSPNANTLHQLSQSDGNTATRASVVARIDQRAQQELVKTQVSVIRTSLNDILSVPASQSVAVHESGVQVHLEEVKSEAGVEMQHIAQPVMPSVSGPEFVAPGLKPTQDSLSSGIVNQVTITEPLDEVPATPAKVSSDKFGTLDNPLALPVNRTIFPLIPIPEPDSRHVDTPACAESALNSPSGTQDSNVEPSGATDDSKSEILTPLERGRRQAALFVQWRRLAAKLGLQSAGDAEAFAKQYKYSDEQIQEIINS